MKLEVRWKNYKKYEISKLSKNFKLQGGKGKSVFRKIEFF